MSNNVDIIKIIEKNPGIKFREIMRETGMKNGALSYHMMKIERNGLIMVERTPGSTRFYPLGLQKDEITVIKHLRNRISVKILKILLEKKRLTIKDIAESLQSSLSWTLISLTKLVRDDLVNVEFEKSQKLYCIKKDDLVKKIIIRNPHNFLKCINQKNKILASFIFMGFGLLQKLIDLQLFDITLTNRIPFI